MTAPDLVEVAATALWDASRSMRGRRFADCSDETRAHFQKQARAVLDALAGAGNVEWGVAWKGSGPSGVLAFDCEEDARDAVELGGLLSRLVFPWTAVRPDNPSKAWRIEHEPEAYFTEARALAKAEAERQIREETNHDHA